MSFLPTDHLIDFTSLTSSLPNLAFIVDNQWRMIWANQVAAQSFPLKEQEPLLGIFGGIDKKEPLKMESIPYGHGIFHSQICQNGRTDTYEWHFYRPEQSRWIYLLAANITEKQKIEQNLMSALKTINDQKHALDQSSIVAITDGTGCITYVNSKFEQISRYSSKELLGQDHRIINSGYHEKKFFKDLWETIMSGKVWKGEIRNRTKYGDFYWVDTTIVPFMDGKNKPYQFVAIRTDITEKKNALEQIEKERLRSMHSEKMASLGLMAAGIAHELGNPIGAITSWLDVISHAAKDGTISSLDFHSTLKTVQQRADHMATIIRSLLIYARDGSKDPLIPLNIIDILENVFSCSTYKIKKTKAELRKKFPSHSVICHGRETELTQVFVNLIANACDAIEGLEQRWIEVLVANEHPYIKVQITDSGSNIDPDLAKKMTEPFFTTKPPGKGTGLGLSISKAILEEHHGKLELDPHSHHTCFNVLVPIGK